MAMDTDNSRDTSLVRFGIQPMFDTLLKFLQRLTRWCEVSYLVQGSLLFGEPDNQALHLRIRHQSVSRECLKLDFVCMLCNVARLRQPLEHHCNRILLIVQDKLMRPKQGF